MPASTPQPPIPARVAPKAGRVVRAGALAGVAAAVAAVLCALIAKAVDVPLEVDGEEIPVAGFAFVTLLWSAVGTGMALAFARWAKRPDRTFLVTTVVLTLASFLPVMAADATTATQAALVLSHVLVAAIVIPSVTLALGPRAR